MILCFDPGHGAPDQGCAHNGIVEKDYVLSLTLQALRVAQAAGIDAHSARLADANLGLAEAADRARDFGAELVIAIHVNAHADPSIRGIRCYAMPGDATAIRVGDTILRAAPGALYLPNRKTRIMAEIRDKSDQRVVNVLSPHRENCPAVLLEVGFATNADDVQCLKSEQGKRGLIAAIVAGASA